MANSDEIIQPQPVLQLPPVNLSQIHPHAAERYVQFLKELWGEVALDQLTEEDLSEDERAKLKKLPKGEAYMYPVDRLVSMTQLFREAKR